MTNFSFTDGHQSNHWQCKHHYCREAASSKIFTCFQLQKVSITIILHQSFIMESSIEQYLFDLCSPIKRCCFHTVQHSGKCSPSTWRITTCSCFLSKLLQNSMPHQSLVMIKVQGLFRKRI
jgi:hypothetical protein